MIGIGTTATTNTSIDISGNITTSGIITRNGSSNKLYYSSLTNIPDSQI